MFPEYGLCSDRAVYILTVRFMSRSCSLCPKSTVYVPRVHCTLRPRKILQYDSRLYNRSLSGFFTYLTLEIV